MDPITGAPENPLLTQIRAQARQALQPDTPPPALMPPPGMDTGAPPIQGTSQPNVQAPRGTIQGEQAERNRLVGSPSGANQVYGKITHSGFGQNHPLAGKILGGLAQGASTAGDILGSAIPGVAPQLAPLVQAIPGSTLHHNLLVKQEDRNINQMQGEQEKTAQTQNIQSEIPLHEAQTAAADLTPATAEEAQAFGVPEGTQLNAASRAALAKQAGINQTKSDTTDVTVQGRKDVAEINGRIKQAIATLKPEQRDDRAIRLMQKDPATLSPEESSYLKSYDQWIQKTKVEPGVARAAAFARFRPVATVDDAGNVTWDTAGHAMATHATTPQSMPFRTQVAMQRFMTSGKGGQLITAYRTAYDHLDMLQKAGDALQNGDIQSINKVANAWQQETGSPGPTNFDSVKTMLTGELANVAKVTGATDSEIQSYKEQINRAASPEQLKGVIQTNQDLMDQKVAEQAKQYESGMTGNVNFGHGGGGNEKPIGTTTKPDGVYEKDGKHFRVKAGNVYAQ